MVLVRRSQGSASTHHVPPPSPVSARTSEWIRVLEEAMSGRSHPGSPDAHHNAASGSTTVAPSPCLVLHSLTFPATIDSQHSDLPQRGSSLLADSYDFRPGVAAALAYLAQQRTAGTPRPGGAC
ncbi:hypothetical protein M758_9G026500 [Ceratodon purpureus]|nr:hypothetical protein M758_9G026500 [Ceratodon purpureus]